MAQGNSVPLAGFVPFRSLEARLCARRLIPYGILVWLRSNHRPDAGAFPMRIRQRAILDACPRLGMFPGCVSHVGVLFFLFVQIVDAPTIPRIPGKCWRITPAKRIPARDVGKIRSREARRGVTKTSGNHCTFKRGRLRTRSMLRRVQWSELPSSSGFSKLHGLQLATDGPERTVLSF